MAAGGPIAPVSSGDSSISRLCAQSSTFQLPATVTITLPYGTTAHPAGVPLDELFRGDIPDTTIPGDGCVESGQRVMTTLSALVSAARPKVS